MGRSRRSVEVAEQGADGAVQAQPDTPSAAASFETALEQLEGTVARLEEGEMPLEEALVLFESGVKLSRQCASTLEAAERRIEILVADRGVGADSAAVPFESEEHRDEQRDDQDDEELED